MPVVSAVFVATELCLIPSTMTFRGDVRLSGMVVVQSIMTYRKNAALLSAELGRYYESGQVSLEFVRQRAEEMKAMTEEIIRLFPQGLIDELDEKGEIRTSARWYLSVFSQYALSHSSFTGMSPQTALRLVGLSHDYFSQFYEFWDREFENETNWKKRSGKKDTL